MPLDRVARAPAPAYQQPPLPPPMPAFPLAPEMPEAPVLRPVDWNRSAREHRSAPAPVAGSAASAPDESPARGRSLTRRASTATANPCIAHDTWSSERSWGSFKETFLDEPGPAFLRLDEENCPICWHAYLENDQTQPVRLPCDSQHVMCLQCVRAWFKDGSASAAANNGCPTCRQVVFKDEWFRTYEMHQAEQDAILEHIQVMRQNSAEIEATVAALWNIVLMRHRDKSHDQV